MKHLTELETRMYKTIQALKNRIKYIGMPEEHMMPSPHQPGILIPDWRHELDMVDEIEAQVELSPWICECGHFQDIHINGKCTVPLCDCRKFESISDKTKTMWCLYKNKTELICWWNEKPPGRVISLAMKAAGIYPQEEPFVYHIESVALLLSGIEVFIAAADSYFILKRVQEATIE